MNKARYEGLPADLRRVIDDNSGAALAARAGVAWEAVEKPGRDAAAQRGNAISTLSAAETAKLREQARRHRRLGSRRSRSRARTVPPCSPPPRP